MKKILAILLVVAMLFCFAACAEKEDTDDNTNNEQTNEKKDDPAVKGEGVMTYAEYAAAELESKVVIEAYVQGHQSWWDNKITVYAQDLDGGYFIYEMECTEENAAKLTTGTKIKVTGYKAEWAGEVEIIDATFEILDGNWVAEPTDVTALLGTDGLIAKQNMLVSFKGVTISSITYKNNEPGDDIYVDVAYGGNTYSFCVEMYLTGPNTDTYKAVQALNVGDVVDIEGFLYWYNGVNTHITGVKAAAAEVKGEGVMTYAEYMAADIDDAVVIEAYVQGHQAWWDNKITVYAQDRDGGYFMYEMACSEADAAKLVPGTKIKVTGYKAEWAGEIEIIDATFEILEGSWIAQPIDVTDLLGAEALIDKQNMLVSFKGVTIAAVNYKSNQPGNDIYVTVTYGGYTYEFCVESYLTGSETAVYKAVEALQIGDVVDIEGFLYWYNGVNTHITAVAASAK